MTVKTLPGGLTCKIYFSGYNSPVAETDLQGTSSVSYPDAAASGGGARDPLCVRFVNTLDWRNDPALRAESLTGYPELLSWAQAAGLLEKKEARELLDRAAARAGEARQALDRALAFRETLYRVLSAVAARRDPAPADLAALNRTWREAASHMLLVPQRNGVYCWDWEGQQKAFDRMLWPIARSASELLTSGPLDRLRECERGGCGWIFVDTTRNRSRRWCAMRICGNRSKVERYYRRHRNAT
jgi:predicted RNA-binding Zn ribbon-like protein